MNKCPMVPLGEVLQLQRRWVKVDPLGTYEEIGVRCFGNGIFHKAPIDGSMLGNKRVLRIEPGDLVFNNVFAWEGAVAVASEAEAGKIGSHRFVTYTVDPARCFADYLRWFFKSEPGLDVLRRVSPGSAGRNRTMSLDQLLKQEVPLPPLAVQQRLVEYLNTLSIKIDEVKRLQVDAEGQATSLLRACYHSISATAPERTMKEIAPLVRRVVQPQAQEAYHELGVRCFGKGTFHKPAIDGAAVGTKKLFSIKANDVVFSNVFAWEGAVAVAKPEDDGRVGSHRFMTCVPNLGVVTAEFVNFHFQTPKGLDQLGEASPGGAGRNRTLGLNALAEIKVPVPAFDDQQWFGGVLSKELERRQRHAEVTQELDAFVPSVLNQAFN